MRNSSDEKKTPEEIRAYFLEKTETLRATFIEIITEVSRLAKPFFKGVRAEQSRDRDRDRVGEEVVNFVESLFLDTPFLINIKSFALIDRAVWDFYQKDHLINLHVKGDHEDDDLYMESSFVSLFTDYDREHLHFNWFKICWDLCDGLAASQIKNAIAEANEIHEAGKNPYAITPSNNDSGNDNAQGSSAATAGLFAKSSDLDAKQKAALDDLPKPEQSKQPGSSPAAS